MLQNSTIHLTRKSASIAHPVSLSMIKSFLRVENDQDDDLILNLISIATEYAEWYMERSLMKQKWQISCIGYIPRKIQLIFGPLIAVESVKIVLRNDSEIVVDQDLYYIDVVGSYIEFYSHFNIRRLDITYEAGHLNADLIPAQIKHGIAHHVAIAYKNREAENSNSLSIVREIYSPFREVKVVL
ncbi:head-tail connector protein [Candidatus Mesenet endosymbiont of Phosphuga atrata]|uniref:head-tail connector protein n=1 Tax=Candidatus Mesenet endosymbiont of Phosphuga atrata TaxID=3066221 RepID=UPI0030D07782